jgi:hypothetical protein
MDEINFHNNFQLLGDLLKGFSGKDKDKADKYIKALNEIYFYTNSAWMSKKNVDANYDDLRERFIEVSNKYKDFL